VVVIPFKQIKVTMLKAFSLLPKQEILSQSHTTSSLKIDTTVISDLTSTTHGTGTAGITTITGDLTMAVGTTLITGVGIIALIILAFLADRWLNRKQELESMDLEEELTNQDF
tara:strand:+ start:787 stop:1125 length:339 start_codon:yes stop_codon:yes gene_type:complete